MKRIVKFFKDIFSNDAGKNCPKTKKIRPKWVIYWVICVILIVLIPTCLVYLEAWEFNWNVVKIVWAEGENYLFRGFHFLFGMLSLLCIFFLGYMTPENLNGDKLMLERKVLLRYFLIFLVPSWIISFITALVLY